LATDPLAAFFSYCRDDSEFALRLAEDVKAAGAVVWIDQLDIEPGQEWDSAIEDAVTRCPRMLLILSAASVQSRNVRNEVAFALDERKSIIPVLYQDCRLPLQLRRIQHIDFRTDYARGLKALLKILGVEHAAQPIISAPSPSPKKSRRPVSDAAPRRVVAPAPLHHERKKEAKRVQPKQHQKPASRAVRKPAIPDEEPTPSYVPADPTLKKWVAENDGELRILQGHSNWVLGVALSGNGRLAVSESYDETLKVWDLQSGRELRTPWGHSDAVKDMALSDDGRRAVSCSGDKTLKVWDLDRGSELHTLRGHSRAVGSVLLSGNGQRAVSRSVSELKVWDVDSGRKISDIDDVEARSVALSEDGHCAISATWDTFTVWDLETGRKLKTVILKEQLRNDVVISVDGRLAIAVSSPNRTLKVWDVDSGRELHKLEGHFGRVTGIGVSADGKCAVSVSEDRTLRIWDVDSGRELARFTAYVDLLCCAISSDKKTIVAGDCNGAIQYLRISG